MRIIRLQAENFKRLVAVDIKPDGNLVEITGPNGAGKSSVLDAIWVALTGTAEAQAMPGKPVRAGQDKATITLDLGDGDNVEFVVTRKFRVGEEGRVTTHVTVEKEGGFKAGKPQTTLDQLLGALTLDPLEFERMKPRAQFDVMKAMVTDYDFDAEEKADEKDRDDRKAINAAAREAEAIAEAIIVPDGVPDEPIDEAALTAELARVGEKNADIQRLRFAAAQERRNLDDEQKAIERLHERGREIDDQINRLRNEEEALRATINTREQALVTAIADNEREEKRVAALIPADTGEIMKKIEAARAVNAGVQKRKDKAAAMARAADKEAAAEEITARIKEREERKRRAIAKAKIPVDGIGFGDGEILLRGVPFKDASDAERLRASIELAIALGGKLRILRVRNGSLIDSKGMQSLAEIAAEKNMQVWIERVDDTGRVGFVMEDGHLK